MAHNELRQRSEKDRKIKMHRMLGGGVDSDEASDRKMVASAIRQHEEHDHKGEGPTKLKLRRGGVADNDGDDDDDMPKARLDRPGRARGGKAPKQHKGAHVNVIVAPQMHPGMAPGPGGAAPATAAPLPPPPHPPMLPPGGPPMMPPGGAPGGMAGGPPIGAMPHPPMPGAGGAPMMMPRKRGGGVDNYPIDDGAASGEGRLEKAKAYGKNSDESEERSRGGRAKK